jgi:hypothetical protein
MEVIVNRHFAATDFQHEDSYRRPKRLYGSLDHIERGDQSTLAAFDCVDADWFDARKTHPQFGKYFIGSDPRTLEDLWRDFWQAATRAVGQSPLDEMPLFRIEIDLIELSQLAEEYGLGAEDSDDELAFAESTWLVFDVAGDARPNWFPSLLYHGMLLPSNDVHVSARKIPDGDEAKTVLNVMMKSLKHLPTPTPTQLSRLLGTTSADYLGAWDVGQGNANALLDASYRASAYFDLGCGVYRNAWTRPANLEFCWSGSATIVLSHWDADHWSGAKIATAAGNRPALSRDWIVPVQYVTVVHLTFASSISSGRLWGLLTGTSLSIGGGRQVTLSLGNGASRNNSGIVMLVENGSSGSDAWLLTGDCDYNYMATPSNQLIALVVPHHGASLAPGSAAIGPAMSANYRRVVYSFGANNAHGKATSHPTPKGVDVHFQAGWSHGSWTPPATPALTLAGADVLATAQHVPGASRANPPTVRFEGALVGWTTPSTPWTRCPSCSGSCQPALPQT